MNRVSNLGNIVLGELAKDSGVHRAQLTGIDKQHFTPTISAALSFIVRQKP